MCEPTEPDWCVCACQDPTCIRGVLPWEPCQTDGAPDAVVWATTVTDIDSNLRRYGRVVVRRG